LAEPDGSDVGGDDQLALLFRVLSPGAGPGVPGHAHLAGGVRACRRRPSRGVLLLPEPTVAQRIVRAKRKIRDAGIRLSVPVPGGMADAPGVGAQGDLPHVH